MGVQCSNERMPTLIRAQTPANGVQGPMENGGDKSQIVGLYETVHGRPESKPGTLFKNKNQSELSSSTTVASLSSSMTSKVLHHLRSTIRQRPTLISYVEAINTLVLTLVIISINRIRIFHTWSISKKWSAEARNLTGLDLRNDGESDIHVCYLFFFPLQSRLFFFFFYFPVRSSSKSWVRCSWEREGWDIHVCSLFFFPLRILINILFTL